MRLNSENSGYIQRGVDNSFIRAERTVISFEKPEIVPSITVFTGLYNGEEYLPGIIDAIESQTYENVLWLLADNDSSDDTWEKLQIWASTTRRSVIIAKNVVNLGGAGSLYANLDLAQGSWVSSMHQDDVYTRDFVRVMLEGVTHSENDPVFGFSDMARISDQNDQLGPFPPGIWAVPDLEPATLFLALIRNHCIPWPAFIVKKELLISTEPPWYSTAFSDTEATLKMLAHGSFVHIPKELMSYRDNPGSESRSISQSDKNLGVALSLLRVFQTNEFYEIYHSVQEGLLPKFTEGLISSLESRLQQSPYRQLVVAQAMEIIDSFDGHRNFVALQKLGQIYGEAGAIRSAELIKSVASLSGKNFTNVQNKTSLTSEPQEVHRSKFSRLIIQIYTKYGYKIPYELRRFFWTKILKLMARQNPLSPWNYNWKKL